MHPRKMRAALYYSLLALVAAVGAAADDGRRLRSQLKPDEWRRPAWPPRLLAAGDATPAPTFANATDENCGENDGDGPNLIYIGILVAGVGNFVSALGLSIQKLGHKHNEGKPIDEHSMKMVYAGFAIYTVGNFGDVIALGMAPQSIVSGLATLILVGNCFFASCLLGEQVHRKEVLSTVLIACGKSQQHSPQHCRNYVAAPVGCGPVAHFVFDVARIHCFCAFSPRLGHRGRLWAHVHADVHGRRPGRPLFGRLAPRRLHLARARAVVDVLPRAES